MSETEKAEPVVEPVVALYPDGRIVFGPGYSVADLLRAVDMLKQAALNTVPNPGRSA